MGVYDIGRLFEQVELLVRGQNGEALTAVNGAAIYADEDNSFGSIAFLNSACDPPPGAAARRRIRTRTAA